MIGAKALLAMAKAYLEQIELQHQEVESEVVSTLLTV